MEIEEFNAAGYSKLLTPIAPVAGPEGIHFRGGDSEGIESALHARLERLELLRYVETTYCGNGSIAFSLRDEFVSMWIPQDDTTQLSRNLGFDTDASTDDLECEILLAMLAAPRYISYPSYEEFAANLNIRRNIVLAARRTQLAFHTSTADRPAQYWTYAQDRGFTVLPGKSLIAALKQATQPDPAGKLYAFSCYRATEYVILLAIAQELAAVNPQLLCQLQRVWEKQPIKSGKFHEVFLKEYGSIEQPVPPKYYVPGDRVWFRNPDAHSSDVSGYEGSWVIYLGGGLFSNFWKRDQPYTLLSKSVEIFHWRHGVYLDDCGELRMDEAVVEARVRETLGSPDDTERVFRKMARLRDPGGVYRDGGCIDASREVPKCICVGTGQIELPGSC